MDVINVTAPAKINLSLDVLGKRQDGYHNLSTIMHEIPLSDEITVKIGTGGGIRATTDVQYIRNDTNIAVKAAKLLLERLGETGGKSEKGVGVQVEIKKNIPVGAGLGGGSADAAAVIKALNQFFGNPLDEAGLMEVGARVGADVPFCIKGGCALCEGIGDIVTPKAKLPGCHIVIVKPKASISTAELFSEYQILKRQMRPDTSGLLEALSEGNLVGAACRVYNVLESCAEKKCRDIPDIHSSLLRHGALGASMTGSGSAVFGIFDDPKQAQNAAEQFSKRYRDTFLLKM